MQRKPLNLFLIFSLIFFSGNFVLAEEIKSTEEGVLEDKTEKIETAVIESKPVYYTLIDNNLKPDEDEFYVSSIYRARGKNKTKIARSKNSRSGDMFTFPQEYAVGDKLTDHLVIKNIIFDTGRYLEVEDTRTKKLYLLRLSHGLAKSKLVLID